MRVLIKGMKMPSNCPNCFASDDDARFCRAAKKYIPMLGKPKFCPLIELPDHGDLIDRDDIENAALMIWCHNSNGDDAMEQTIEYIRHNIEAVIPAERSEDETH